MTRTLHTSTRRLSHSPQGDVLDTDHGPFSVGSAVALSRDEENKIVILTLDDHRFVTGVRVLGSADPVCRCCNGDGMHHFRAYAAGASPYDDDEECTLCEGRGRTIFNTRGSGLCPGGRELQKRHR